MIKSSGRHYPVKLTHCPGNALADPAFDLIGRAVHRFFHKLSLLRAELIEHVIRDPALAALGPSDPDSQPWILARAQVLLDRFQPVVPAAAAARTHPNFTQAQIRIVHY